MAAIVVDGLQKRYGVLRAVDQLSFAVADGEVFALVGPNGAGKTTTVEILEGYRRRDAGRVLVLGCDPASGGRAWRERIGIVLQEASLDEEFSVRELVELYAGFYPHPRGVDEVIDLVGLADKRNARVRTLSGGQRRRADLALGLIGDPELLFLDEPTTGFDPSARHRAWEVIDSLRALGKTILLTTHYMDEAQHLADRVAIIAKGRLVALGTPAELVERELRGLALITFQLPSGATAAELPQLRGALTVTGTEVMVRTRTPTQDLHGLTAWALARGFELAALDIQRPSLEDVYLDLVRRVPQAVHG